MPDPVSGRRGPLALVLAELGLRAGIPPLRGEESLSVPAGELSVIPEDLHILGFFLAPLSGVIVWSVCISVVLLDVYRSALPLAVPHLRMAPEHEPS